MIRGTGRRPGLGLLLAIGVAALVGPWMRGDTARAEPQPIPTPPVVVEVLARPHSRLADDLVRELGASGFVAVARETTSSDWRAEVRRLPGGLSHHGVVVRADERLMTVFTRAGGPDTIQSRFDQAVEPGDRMARRRACLGVVEYLRVLSETAAADGGGAPASSGAGTGASGAVPRSRGPDGRELGRAEAVDGAPRSPSRSTSQPAAGAPSQRRGAGVPGANRSDEANRAGNGARPAAGTASLGAADNEAAGQTPSRLDPWQLGVGSRLGLEAAPGGPTGHLLFLWYLPLDWRLGLCARAVWPVVGGQFRSGGNDVRTWTFGSALSLQYQFNVGRARLRPYVGAEVGARVALSETTPVNALQSRESFTPSATVGAEGGVRYPLRPPIQLFLEVGVGRGWLIPGVNRAEYETAAANANSLHASFGALFEI